jgi:hypothetical protein
MKIWFIRSLLLLWQALDRVLGHRRLVPMSVAVVVSLGVKKVLVVLERELTVLQSGAAVV